MILIAVFNAVFNIFFNAVFNTILIAIFIVIFIVNNNAGKTKGILRLFKSNSPYNVLFNQPPKGLTCFSPPPLNKRFFHFGHYLFLSLCPNFFLHYFILFQFFQDQPKLLIGYLIITQSFGDM